MIEIVFVVFFHCRRGNPQNNINNNRVWKNLVIARYSSFVRCCFCHIWKLISVSRNHVFEVSTRSNSVSETEKECSIINRMRSSGGKIVFRKKKIYRCKIQSSFARLNIWKKKKNVFFIQIKCYKFLTYNCVWMKFRCKITRSYNKIT